MKKVLSFLFCCLLTLCLCSCENMDPNYGKSSSKVPQIASEENAVPQQQIQVPEIKSDDEAMPTYFDISLYDEENYADIYLGKKFEYKMTYGGSTLDVPAAYKDMTKEGWALIESDEYNENSQILVGKSLEVNFVNQYNKQITAVFYNDKKSSAPLKKCSIVKFKIPENIFVNPDSVYGQFWVNGVSNESAITDIIEYLGAPSHFYRVSENKYYLDWFITESDRRSGITVYIDIAEDRVDAIEVSYY